MVAGRIASSVVQRQVKHVAAVPAARATGLVARVYEQVADEMRIVVPPAAMHSPSPATLAAYWMLTREPMLPRGTVDRATKEAVAAAVSVANICPYCAEMHSVGLYELSTEHDAEAVVTDRAGSMADPALRAAAGWARTAHLIGGAALPDDTGPVERAELVGIVVGFHYLTRMVNVFLSSFMLPPQLGPHARRRLKQGISRVLRPTLRSDWAPGRSLDLLPPAALPDDAGWAAPHPHVASAVARAAAAFEAAGRRSVPPAVRAAVLRLLDDWTGEDEGLSNAWCEDVVADLPAPQRASGRLALLTAFASYRVDERVVEEFRQHDESDAVLVDTAAWASFTVARAVGARHARPGGDHGS